MYQYRSGLLPYSFNNMFLKTHQVHSYSTRSSDFFYLPQCRTNIRKFSFSFQGPKFFNSLSFEIRNATSTAWFCCKLKAFLSSYININFGSAAQEHLIQFNTNVRFFFSSTMLVFSSQT